MNLPNNSSVFCSQHPVADCAPPTLSLTHSPIPQILAVAVSVTGVVIVAVFSNSCSTDQSTDHNSTTNASSPSPPSWGPQPLLGHIHRGSSCTEKSTFPGYLVSCGGRHHPNYTHTLTLSFLSHPPSLRLCSTVSSPMLCLRWATRSGALKRPTQRQWPTVYVTLATWGCRLWYGCGLGSSSCTTLVWSPLSGLLMVGGWVGG